MKKILFLLVICFGWASGQSTEKQVHQKIVYTEPATFPGGDQAFQAELHKMVYSYLDMDQYAANGLFNFLLEIDEKGKIVNVSILPKVKNSDMFVDDMTFAVKRIKPRWTPAMTDGKPVKSKRLVRIHFISDHFDHD